jgi:hypothetical protein
MIVFMPFVVWILGHSRWSQRRMSKNLASDAAMFLDFKLQELVDDLEQWGLHVTATEFAGYSAHRKMRHVIKETRSSFSGKAISIAVVEPGNAYQGVFSTVNSQERALLDLMCDADSRRGSVFIRVLEVAPLSNPTTPIIQGGKSLGNAVTCQLAEAWTTTALAGTVVGGGTVQSVLEGWRGRYPNAFDMLVGGLPRAGVCQPTLVALMLGHGQLNQFLVRHDQRYAAEPYLSGMVSKIRAASKATLLDARGNEDQQFFESQLQQDLVPEPLDRDMFIQIGDSLRSYLDDLRKQLLPDGGARQPQIQEEIKKLQRQIVWLQAQHTASSDDKFIDMRLQRRRGGLGTWSEELGIMVAYKPAFLLECIMLAFHLRNTSDLAGAVSGVMGLLPDFWTKTIVQKFEQAALPSASTLSRARLYVDAAFMLLMREKHDSLLSDPDLKLFIKIDSTPLAGNNWEVVEYEAVHGENLVRAGDLASSLAQRGSLYRDGGQEIPPEVARHALPKILLHDEATSTGSPTSTAVARGPALLAKVSAEPMGIYLLRFRFASRPLRV